MGIGNFSKQNLANSEVSFLNMWRKVPTGAMGCCFFLLPNKNPVQGWCKNRKKLLSLIWMFP